MDEEVFVPLDPIEFIRPALRWERRTQKKQTVFVPNVVDTGSAQSIKVASALYRMLDIRPMLT